MEERAGVLEHIYNLYNKLIDWYIELLDAGSEKYIVPQSRAHLVNVRNQLAAVLKKIMDTPIPKADRAIISINYLKGYEG